MSILIKDVLLEETRKDIYIEGNQIKTIGESLDVYADKVIDGSRKAAIPGFTNGHTHAAMTLFRGYADDMRLMEWLEQKIWPNEAKLNEEDVYWGAKLACLEMIKSGTTFFNDMYWHYHGTAKAVEEMGIRAVLTAVMFDFFNPDQANHMKEQAEQLIQEQDRYSNRIVFGVGPHAIYTVSPDSLMWVKEFAQKHNLLIHIHLSETQTEVQEAIKNHGKRPVEYLADIGFLGPEVIAAHCIWLEQKEIELLAKHQVKVVHNPLSNLKLASGIHFPYKQLREAGVTVGVGTDGCSSSNNLDMLEALKATSLLQKAVQQDPTAVPVHEALDLGTSMGEQLFGLPIGQIKEGYFADLSLVELQHPKLYPNHHFLSNLVYSAHSDCIDTVICDGRVLMENRYVPGEEEILERTQKVTMNWINRKM